jgi:hypothetical protein
MITRQQKQIISFILLLVVMVLPMLAMADDGGTPDNGGELDTPIDGGLSLLAAAGVGYGAKKMKERRAQKELL